MIKKAYIGLHVQYSLFESHCSKTWIFPTNFSKNTQLSYLMKSFHWEPSSFMRAGVRAGGRTYRHSRFSQFCASASDTKQGNWSTFHATTRHPQLASTVPTKYLTDIQFVATPSLRDARRQSMYLHALKKVCLRRNSCTNMHWGRFYRLNFSWITSNHVISNKGPCSAPPSPAQRCFLPFLYPFDIHSVIKPLFIFRWTIQFLRFLYCQTIERKLLLFQRKVSFLFHFNILTLKIPPPPFFLDMSLSELQ